MEGRQLMQKGPLKPALSRMTSTSHSEGAKSRGEVVFSKDQTRLKGRRECIYLSLLFCIDEFL